MTPKDSTGKEDLKGCPFCGPGNSAVSPYFDDMYQAWRVACGRCAVSTGFNPKDRTKDKAIELWNRRAE
jgi:Lar family restriction alleviation protein